MTFLTNTAAVYFEQGEMEKCRETCFKAIEVGRENRADYTLVAKCVVLFFFEKLFCIIQTALCKEHCSFTLRRAKVELNFRFPFSCSLLSMLWRYWTATCLFSDTTWSHFLVGEHKFPCPAPEDELCVIGAANIFTDFKKVQKHCLKFCKR